jgi:hypothetical protein
MDKIISDELILTLETNSEKIQRELEINRCLRNK